MESNTANQAVEKEIRATCWCCTSAVNKKNKVEKYQRDAKGKLVKEKVESNRKNELKKVLNPNYVKGVICQVKVTSKGIVDGKCRVMGECLKCSKPISSYVKKVESLDQIGDVVQATCWSCTSAYNKERKQTKYKKDPAGKLVRELRPRSNRPKMRKVLNKNYVRSVPRAVIVQREFYDKNKIRVEGKCKECGSPVSAFITNNPKKQPQSAPQLQQ